MILFCDLTNKLYALYSDNLNARSLINDNVVGKRASRPFKPLDLNGTSAGDIIDFFGYKALFADNSINVKLFVFGLKEFAEHRLRKSEASGG